jgi:glycerol-3-phosphate dehydrogenase (NAD(P)+)
VTKIAILGGGSWGTALSIVLARSRRSHDITLWARDSAAAEGMRERRVNEKYLPGMEIPACVKPSSDLHEVLKNAHVVVAVLPAAHARRVLVDALPYISPEAVIVSAAKGLEPSTHLRMSEVIGQVFSLRYVPRVAVLSGPSFALEAARGEPTAVVIAARENSVAAFLQEEFSGPAFRLYTNDDVLGVELAGPMKNVMAIAAGACRGLGLGDNSLAALITRGLAEMTRLAVALGARAETLHGLAGLGDLVLTCTGALSRNRQVGIELGKGRSLKEILTEMIMIAEGVGTTAPLLDLAKQHHVDTPITEQVNAILQGWKSPADAIRDIMERPLKRE